MTNTDTAPSLHATRAALDKETAANASLRTVNAHLCRCYHDQRARLIHTQDSAKSLRDEVEELKAQLGKLSRIIRDQDAQIAHRGGEILNRDDHIKALECDISSLNGELAKKQAEIAKKQLLNTALSDTIDGLRDQKHALREELSRQGKPGVLRINNADIAALLDGETLITPKGLRLKWIDKDTETLIEPRTA